jgi:diguanylate cyclase (GGDEF)-like protein
MPFEDLTAIRRLEALVELTRLVGEEGHGDALLDAIARLLAETVGFAGVVINVFRPAWDDFEAVAVAGSEAMRDELRGATYPREQFVATTLDERFERRGAYFVPEGAVDWDTHAGPRHVPADGFGDDPDAWRPADELFVPCRDSEGRILAIISLGEPVSGRRPSEIELDVLVAVGKHAALALEHAQRDAITRRHLEALELLLGVSSELAGQASTESVLQSVCSGVQRGLEFQKVLIELRDPATGLLSPRACAGWAPGSEPHWELADETLGALVDPAFELGGCYLLPEADALARAPQEFVEFRSEMNGRGPLAWNHHWLFVPLRDQSGAMVGRIWADDPADRLLPSKARLEVLALFANQATMAIVSAGQVERLRILADEDALTGLHNRRAFMRELDVEVGRALRYGRPLTLVLCDVDHFKLLNDTHGHPGGDRALRHVAHVLETGLRTGDGAFRIGGDEFALLLPETTGPQATVPVRRVSDAFEEHTDPPFTGLRVSCGVATLPFDAADAETLIRQADLALYAEKRARQEPARRPVIGF